MVTLVNNYQGFPNSNSHLKLTYVSSVKQGFNQEHLWPRNGANSDDWISTDDCWRRKWPPLPLKLRSNIFTASVKDGIDRFQSSFMKTMTLTRQENCFQIDFSCFWHIIDNRWGRGRNFLLAKRNNEKQKIILFPKIKLLLFFPGCWDDIWGLTFGWQSLCENYRHLVAKHETIPASFCLFLSFSSIIHWQRSI